MKKILLATTAVVALTTISAEAFAAEKIQLSLGGFQRHYVGVANNDEVATTNESARGVNLSEWQNGEIYFNGSTKLDNGITVSVKNQLENSAKGATGRDETSVSFSSDAIGTLKLGSASHTIDSLAVRIPQATSLDWTDGTAITRVANDAATAGAGWGSATTNVVNSFGDKDMGLRYTSPTFSGVTVAVSYAAGNVQNNIKAVTNAAEDMYSYGIAYSGEASGVAIDASLNHGNVAVGYEVNHVGLSLGTAGFTVAGGYSDFNDTVSAATAATTNDLDGNSWEIGLGYETGPYTATLGYTKMKNTGSTATTTNSDNEASIWAVGGAYSMGAGVTLVGEYFKAKSKAETATKDDSVSGVIVGVEIGF